MSTELGHLMSTAVPAAAQRQVKCGAPYKHLCPKTLPAWGGSFSRQTVPCSPRRAQGWGRGRGRGYPEETQRVVVLSDRLSSFPQGGRGDPQFREPQDSALESRF